MTKRDFFRVLIRIFALYSIIISVFSLIPSTIVTLFQDFGIWIVLAELVIVALIILIYFFLIKKTDQIIDFIHIDKGFDNENLEFGNLTINKILMLGIIITGGLLLFTNLADFILYTFQAFKTLIQKGTENQYPNNNFGTTFNYYRWITTGINIVIGYLLLTNYDTVVKWLSKKEKDV